MAFMARFIHGDKPILPKEFPIPGRFMVHQCYTEHLHGPGTHVGIDRARHLIQDMLQGHYDVLKQDQETGKETRYTLGVLWANKKGEIKLDLIPHSDFKSLEGRDWRTSNPDTRILVSNLGTLMSPGDIERICEDTWMFVSEEAKLRRGTRNLQEFIEHPAYLGAIEPSTHEWKTLPLYTEVI